MFDFGHVPPGTRRAQPELCQRCNCYGVSPEDVFWTHCALCLAEIRAEVDADSGAAGPIQRVLATHRAFDEWLRTHGAHDA